jgi:PAS domain-containing protein
MSTKKRKRAGKPGSAAATVRFRRRPAKSGSKPAAKRGQRPPEASFRLLFDSNPVPMIVCALEDQSILAVNDAAIQHYGYSRGEFEKLTIRSLQAFDVGLPWTGDEGAARTWKHVRADGARWWCPTGSVLVGSGGRGRCYRTGDTWFRRHGAAFPASRCPWSGEITGLRRNGRPGGR